ncbi:MAG: GNAT family N-acetyltransferase [Sulfurimonas sp.]|nr:GNAT family N-acetyltransferase [Sulfurimonas sp.]
MTLALYFLRSSEQNIIKDMLYFSARLDEVGKTIDDFTQLDIYSKFYGLTTKDLGLYALVGNKIAGAVWLRELKQSDNANAFVDEKTPILNIAVKPELRGQGIGSAMLEQLFLEAGALYEQISISVLNNKKTINYFEKFAFSQVENSSGRSPVDGAEVITMIKSINNEAVVRPSDGYDPRRWMD